MKFAIAGDGQLRAELEQQVEDAQLGDRVAFLGWLDEGGKAAFYRSVDVVCYTSGRDVQPLTVLEAFGWGKALVGTDVLGGSSCYEDGQTALVTRMDDAAQLAATLERLGGDAELRDRLGRNAREQAMRCHADTVVAGMLDRRVRELSASFARPWRVIGSLSVPAPAVPLASSSRLGPWQTHALVAGVLFCFFMIPAPGAYGVPAAWLLCLGLGLCGGGWRSFYQQYRLAVWAALALIVINALTARLPGRALSGGYELLRSMSLMIPALLLVMLVERRLAFAWMKAFAVLATSFISLYFFTSNA